MNHEELKENFANDVKEQMESKYGSEVTVETRMEITDIFHIHGVKIKLFLIHIPPKYKKAATSAALIRFHLTVGFTALIAPTHSRVHCFYSSHSQ